MIFSTDIVPAPLPEITRPELRSTSACIARVGPARCPISISRTPQRQRSQAPTRDGSYRSFCRLPHK
jgi:hypothetical protein